MFEKIKLYFASLNPKNRFPAFDNLSQLGNAIKKSDQKSKEKDYQKEKFIQYLAMGVMLSTLVYIIFVLLPIVQDMKQTSRDLLVYQQDFGVLDSNNKLLDKYQDKNSEYKKLDILLKRSIPSRSDIEQSIYMFQKDILENQRLRGIKIDSIAMKDNIIVSTSGSKTLKTPLYRIEYTIAFQNVKTYEDVKWILDIIEKNYRIYEVSDLKATASDKKDQKDIWFPETIKFSAYYTKNEPTITPVITDTTTAPKS